MIEIERFLKSLDSEHTRRAYRTDLRRFFQELDIEAADVSSIRVETSDIESFLRSMQDRDLSTSTMRRRIAAIRHFFDWLVSEGHHQVNPCRAASLTVESSSKSKEDTVLSKEDLQKLLRMTEGDTRTAIRDRALLLVILYGALRRSELASLNVGDFRPLGRHWVIDLPRRGQLPGGYVKIPDRAASAVQDVIEIYDEEDGPLWRSFSNRNLGDRMTPDALYKRVRHLGKKAELGVLNIQTLRRSALRLASAEGASLEDIRRHARLKSDTSAAEYLATDSEETKLNTAAVDFLDIDV